MLSCSYGQTWKKKVRETKQLHPEPVRHALKRIRNKQTKKLALRLFNHFTPVYN